MVDQQLTLRIKDAAQIEEIIGDYIQLKKAWINYKANCPFHKEKTDSLINEPS